MLWRSREIAWKGFNPVTIHWKKLTLAQRNVTMGWGTIQKTLSLKTISQKQGLWRHRNKPFLMHSCLDSETVPQKKTIKIPPYDLKVEMPFKIFTYYCGCMLCEGGSSFLCLPLHDVKRSHSGCQVCRVTVLPTEPSLHPPKCLFHDPATPLLVLYSRAFLKIRFQEVFCILCTFGTLFSNQTWKEAQCPSTDEWFGK